MGREESGERGEEDDRGQEAEERGEAEDRGREGRVGSRQVRRFPGLRLSSFAIFAIFSQKLKKNVEIAGGGEYLRLISGYQQQKSTNPGI